VQWQGHHDAQAGAQVVQLVPAVLWYWLAGCPAAGGNVIDITERLADWPVPAIQEALVEIHRLRLFAQALNAENHALRQEIERLKEPK
jgi:hypothetical protein